MEKKVKKVAEGDDEELSAVPEEDNMEAEEEEGREDEESEEFSFPDTTISLSHLQPSR